MLPKVAAVTMAFEEPVLLPVWARHYARQVGADHCYVVDHGSSSEVKLTAGVNKLRIPRSPHDDVERATFVGCFVESLLSYYDWVIYTDVDELILADPQHFQNIPSFCASLEVDTVTAIGFDIQHVTDIEGQLRFDQSIGKQRGWARFTSAMCKPVLTRRRVQWAPGFHSADVQQVFSHLYLFHLHWADRTIGQMRLVKTRAMPWADAIYGAHQRVSDREWNQVFDGMAAFPRQESVSFAPDSIPLADWLQRTRASVQTCDGRPSVLDLHINASELWAIPPRFRMQL